MPTAGPADIDEKHYAWHCEPRRYRAVPQAGFGLGFEPTLAYAAALPTCAAVA